MRYDIEDLQQIILSAGQIAPPGHYRRVDEVASRVVVLSREDVLPASLDGRVAQYVRLEDTVWLGQPATLGERAEFLSKRRSQISLWSV